MASADRGPGGVAAADSNAKDRVGNESVGVVAPMRGTCFGAALLALTACAVPPAPPYGQTDADNSERFRAAVQTAIDCRTTAARDRRYVDLGTRMPLEDIAEANLPQMIDPQFTTSGEIALLDAWTGDVGACRDQLLLVTYTTLPGFGPIIEQARDDDDAIYVMIARHKLTWGQGVMRLKVNRTKMRAALIAYADQINERTANMAEEVRNRRAMILSSVIRVLP